MKGWSTQYPERSKESPLIKLLRQKDIDGLTLDQFQKVLNKVIKPYIVRRNEGNCSILIPLSEYDTLANKIFEGVEENRKKGVK
jgi:hypothetical protein